VLERQSKHLLRLVDDLLDLEQLARGKISLRKRHLALSEVIDAALALCRPLMDSNNRHFSVALPLHTVSIEVDPERMTQVIINLVHNAFKYTPIGGSIELTAEIENAELIIRVRDDGQGISPELLPRIFDMYAQGEALSRAEHRGLGVGLAIVRKLVELHGGSVAVQSDGLLKGSTFLIRLPVIVKTALAESSTATQAWAAFGL
jgi:signal transduction histidine kinase